MKQLALVFVLPLAFACAPDISVRITNAAKLDDTCSAASGDVSVSSGQIDLSGTSSYLAKFGVVSNLDVSEIKVGNDVLSPGNRNDAIIQQMTLRYSSVPNLSLRPESSPLHFVIQPSTNENLMGVNLIGPVAGQTLRDSLSAGDSAQLNVGLVVRGQLASGGAFTSNEIIFPIFVYRTDPAACPNGAEFARTGPCGNNGQDESVLRCR
jgi:hypothetical protein